MGWQVFIYVIDGAMIDKVNLELVIKKFNIDLEANDLSCGLKLGDSQYYLKSYNNQQEDDEDKYSIVLKEKELGVAGKVTRNLPYIIKPAPKKKISEFKKWLRDTFNDKLQYSQHIQLTEG